MWDRGRERRTVRQTDRQTEMYHSVAEQTIHKLRNPSHAEPRSEQLVNIFGDLTQDGEKKQHSATIPIHHT